METHSIVWRRLDRPGHEAARIEASGEGWRLAGTAVLAADALPCRLDYSIELDAGFVTRAVRVTGWIGTRAIDLAIAADGAGSWSLGGSPAPEVTGCLDIDLGFSPSTNLLPIRRLGLAEGEEASVRAAWLPFPSLRLEPLEQRYRRIGPRRWRYESRDGAFVRELTVDRAGFPTLYPGLWQAEAAAPSGDPA
ncbi:MAG TPA: putative glycolipid-binding domain-containing protein [Thermoanaerobaculia bacterium]|nr:putative glycolipid-binding domain-containing protein [Thermoanaerobaculia bacterium]